MVERRTFFHSIIVDNNHLETRLSQLCNLKCKIIDRRPDKNFVLALFDKSYFVLRRDIITMVQTEPSMAITISQLIFLHIRVSCSFLLALKRIHISNI